MKKIFMLFGLLCIINLMSAQQTVNMCKNGHDIQVSGTRTVSNFPASDIQFWVGTGSNSAVVVIGWDDNPSGQDFALAWGVRWNGSCTAVNMLDTIATYDQRIAYAISSGFVTSIGYNDGNLISGSTASYWCYNVNNAYADAYSIQPMANGDYMEISSSCMFSLTTATAATNPNPSDPTPAEATIDFSEILYWVGEGSKQAVMAVNWADTALAWGYRWDGTATVADMMDDIAAADPRFSYIASGFLDDINYIDAAAGMTTPLGITPGNYWGSTNNGIMDMGLGQTLNDGDFEKWADPAAGVIIDSTYDATYNYWWYTYVYPMTIYPVSEPTLSVGNHEMARVQAYPNPCTGTLNIISENAERVELYDINGKLLEVVNSSDTQTTLNMHSYSSGLYLLKVGNNVQKIMKK